MIHFPYIPNCSAAFPYVISLSRSSVMPAAFSASMSRGMFSSPGMPEAPASFCSVVWGAWSLSIQSAVVGRVPRREERVVRRHPAGDPPAGGLVDGSTEEQLRAKGLSVAAVLADNDSYHALKAIDALIMTGPTGTNVNDVAVALIEG